MKEKLYSIQDQVKEPLKKVILPEDNVNANDFKVFNFITYLKTILFIQFKSYIKNINSKDCYFYEKISTII